MREEKADRCIRVAYPIPSAVCNGAMSNTSSMDSRLRGNDNRDYALSILGTCITFQSIRNLPSAIRNGRILNPSVSEPDVHRQEESAEIGDRIILEALESRLEGDIVV